MMGVGVGSRERSFSHSCCCSTASGELTGAEPYLGSHMGSNSGKFRTSFQAPGLPLPKSPPCAAPPLGPPRTRQLPEILSVAVRGPVRVDDLDAIAETDSSGRSTLTLTSKREGDRSVYGLFARGPVAFSGARLFC